MTLQELNNQNFIGPTRIVINEEGEAKHPSRTDVRCSIVFVRNDGWSLGAPYPFAKVAYDMWPKEWIGFALAFERSEDALNVRPMEELSRTVYAFLLQ